MLPYFEWLESHGPGRIVRDSSWLFPAIEAVHLLAFAVVGGTVLLVSLRLIGLGMPRRPAAVLAQEVRPWFTWGLATMAATGLLLFMSVAVKCYYSAPFWVKISSLFIVLVLTIAFGNRVTAPNASPLLQRMAGVLSLTLWGAVAWGGRWIGFS
jgi:hypothetical protein